MITGILLAAGRSTRFGANKLLHPLSDGIPVLVAALRSLREGVDDVLVVVRPEDAEVIALLKRERAHVIPCATAGRGMGASLACGVRASGSADGWLVALADMPHIPPALVGQLKGRLENGAAIVAPVCHGRRGHPVGFGREFLVPLSQLDGDAGARFLLEAHLDRLECIATTDSGVLRDIDTPADLLAIVRARRGLGTH